VTAPAETDALTVGDAGRHVDAQRAAPHLAAAPVAAFAGLLGHLALAAADVAGDAAHDLPERRARHRLQHARAATALAGLDRRAGLGAVAVAALARLDRLEGQLELLAGRRLLERDLRAHRDVAAGPRAVAGCARGPESHAAEERVEQVADRAERAEVRAHPPAAQPLVAVAVVRRAALGVVEDLVGLGGLLELALGVGVVRVDVRVQLTRELAKRLLDRRLVGVARDAQDLVGIARHRAAHAS